MRAYRLLTIGALLLAAVLAFVSVFGTWVNASDNLGGGASASGFDLHWRFQGIADGWVVLIAAAIAAGFALWFWWWPLAGVLVGAPAGVILWVVLNDRSDTSTRANDAGLSASLGWGMNLALVAGILLAVVVGPTIPYLIYRLGGPTPAGDSGSKDCPECAETVRAGARVCRFCGHRFADRV
jgi:hypothetical protein